MTLLTKDFQSLPSKIQGKSISADRPSGPFTVKNTKVFIVPTEKGYEMKTARELKVPKALFGTKLSEQQQLDLVTKKDKGVSLVVNKDGQLTTMVIKLNKERRPELLKSAPVNEQELKTLSSSMAVKLASAKSLKEFKNTAQEYGATYKHLQENKLFTKVQSKKIAQHFDQLKADSKREKTELKTAVGEEKNQVKLSAKTLIDESLMAAQKAERNQRIEANLKSAPTEPKERKEKKRERTINTKRSNNLGR